MKIFTWAIVGLCIFLSGSLWAGGSLTFEERVAAQEAIERVYYNHRIWPKENPGPKPPFEQVVPRAALEAKVRDYIRKSVLLENFWQQPMTGEQLQAEMNRMAANSKDPDRLKELFAALGNDPFRIAECLTRPLLADRLIRTRFAHDPRIHGDLQAEAQKLHDQLTPDNFSTLGRNHFLPVQWTLRSATTDGSQEDGLDAEQFQKMTGSFPAPGTISGIEDTSEYFVIRMTERRTDTELSGAVIALPKERFEDWLSRQGAEEELEAPEYEYCLPAPEGLRGTTFPDSPESWAALWYAPEGRHSQSTVWTGSEMIIWGGQAGPLSVAIYLNTGGRYDPASDSWTPTSVTNDAVTPVEHRTPAARRFHTAVWTGEDMIIWGGGTSGYFNTGSRYNPWSDTWTATNTTSVPTARRYHAAVWTGSCMIVWGGQGSGGNLNTGSRYYPSTDTWDATSTTSAPSARQYPGAVWTGEVMLVWSGFTTAYVNDGGRYDPWNDLWTPMSTTGAPVGRMYFTPVWTGEEMIVWGGYNTSTALDYLSDGGRYFPNSDTWVAVSSAGDPPTPRHDYSAVWTGEDLIIWGGYGCTDDTCSGYIRELQGGSRFNPRCADTTCTSGRLAWMKIDYTNEPTGRMYHSAVWTGAEMIIWGGTTSGYQTGSNVDTNTGGRYNPTYDDDGSPVTLGWSSINSLPQPTERWKHSTVWTGSELIIFGGFTAFAPIGTGGRYDPATDAWTALFSTTVKMDHSAVWTGTEMIVWGGYEWESLSGSGRRYNPLTNTWTLMGATSDPDQPSGRAKHTAVWTGDCMVVWGGCTNYSTVNDDFCNGATTATGSRYYPSYDNGNSADNAWVAVASLNAPGGRVHHTALWTGTRMLIHGGNFGTTAYNGGGRYNPGTYTGGDAWETMAVSAIARTLHSAVWTGTDMIVFGGRTAFAGSALASGEKYNPAGDTWTFINGSGNPGARHSHKAVWTGESMIAWGGINSTPAYLNTGGRYYPGNDIWGSMASTGVPSKRGLHSMVWTGESMIVWDGYPTTQTGGIYYPDTPPRAFVALSTSTGGDATFTLGDGEILTLDGTISMDGSNSTALTPNHDKFDSITTYEWELNGDTDLESNCQFAPSTRIDRWGGMLSLDDTDLANLGIGRPGSYKIWLRVVDENGGKDCTSAFLEVVDGVPPTVTLVSPNGGESLTYSEDSSQRKNHLVFWGAADNFNLKQARISYTTDGNNPMPAWTDIATLGFIQTFTYTGTPVSIPDTTGYSNYATISVPVSDLITDVNVKINISHARVGDLRVYVYRPDGTPRTLSLNRGGSGADFIDTVFDDEATKTIASGLAPFSGAYRPEYALSAFDGLNSLGTWRLRVYDSVAGVGGQINSWSVTLSYKPASNLSWIMPTQAEAAASGQTFPTATARVKVEVWDESGNTASDTSDANFYIIQPTTTAVKTLIGWNSARICSVYDQDPPNPDCACASASSDPDCTATQSIASKLAELADHAKVSGVVLDLDTVPAVQSAYTAWDLAPSDQALANDVASAIRTYLLAQIDSAYTNTQFIQLVGDDGQIPFYRLTDGAVIHTESQYPGEGGLNTATTVGSALAAGYFLTDNYYGEYGGPDGFEPTGIDAPPDNAFVYMEDFAVGRLVETPAQMEGVINTFLAQDGQLTFTAGGDGALVAGWTFMYDTALAMRGQYTAAGKATDCLLDDPDASGTTDPCVDAPFTPADLSARLFSSPLHKLTTVNTHGLHYGFSASTAAGGKDLLCTDPAYNTLCYAAGMDANGIPLTATLLYTPACHAGLSVPSTEPTRPLDLPEQMARKGVPAYIANTGYGWGMDIGSGLSEALMELFTAELLNTDSIAIGAALANAKRTYLLNENRWDVFDQKVAHELTLYGIPNYLLVARQTRGQEDQGLRTKDQGRGEEELPPPDGPDKGCADGICLEKSFSGGEGLLPPGVTELNLHFTFCGGALSTCTCPPQSYPNCTYQRVTTATGQYYKLNNRASGEVDATVQPHFVYNSYLSGTLAHGVLFTGGGYECETPFTPVVAAPASTAYTPSAGPDAPSGGMFVPSVRASFGTAGGLGLRDLGQIGYTNLTVPTGFYTGAIPTGSECRFADMTFVNYYSNAADKLSPVVADPGPGGFHTLTGLTAAFAATVTDASGVYRVLVTYNDGRTSQWKSLDLTSASGNLWTGSLALKGSIDYYVQAVDAYGNVGMLAAEGQDLDPLGTPYGSSWEGPKLFDITLPDSDLPSPDGLPDAYENLHACLDPGANDAALDPDYDYLTSAQEFTLDTDPCAGDSDGGGENDGSELNANGTAPKRNPLYQADDKHLTIFVVKNGADYDVTWPPASGDNGAIDGYYFVYRSDTPFFDPADRVNGTPIADGTAAYTDVAPPCSTCYYNVWNTALDTLPPVVAAVAPNTGPAAGGTSVGVYGSNFQSGAKVYFDNVLATNIIFISSNMLTCTTPAHAAGAVTIKVVNPNTQEGSLAGGYSYQ